MPPEHPSVAQPGDGRSSPDERTDQLARASVRSIRAAAVAWGELDRDERRRRIRTHLARAAQAASIEPRELASSVAALLPAPEGASKAGTPEPRVPVAPAEPVEHILGLVGELSETDRKRLISGLRERGYLPEERPAPALPTPPAAPPLRSPASLGSALSDQSFLELLDGLGVELASERAAGADGPSPQQLADIEARAARQGLRRSQLTPDLIAVALAHLARAVGEFSEEHEMKARGMPEAIRQFYPNTPRAPIRHLKDYLAGSQNCDAHVLRRYLDEYFEPYRQLSERLPRLCEKLNAVAMQFNPKGIEEKAPKSLLGGLSYDKVWEVYKARYEEQATKGFGASREATRGWLFKQWLI